MKYGIALLLLFFFVSCSSDDSPSNPSNENGTLIKTLKKFGSTGNLEIESNYFYNSEGNISQILVNSYEGESSADFTYDEEGKLISFLEVATDVFDEVRIEQNNFQYSGENIVLICQEITYENSDSPYDQPEVDKIEFDFSAAGNVTEIRHYFEENAENNTCETVQNDSNTEYLNYNSSGNMIRYENTDYFFSPVYFEYEYDDLNHAFRNVKPDSYRKLLGFSTINNISYAEEFNKDTNELTAIITYNYTYNDNGYPTLLERRYSSPGGEFFQDVVWEYSYY